MANRRRGRLISVAVGGLLLASPLPTYASVPCQDSNLNYQFDGFNSPGQVYGVKGEIKDKAILLCTTPADDDSAAAAWVMMTGAGLYQYAQVGYWKKDTLSWLRFVEYSYDLTHWTHINYSSPAFADAVYRSYQVSYSNADHRIHFYIQGSQVEFTSWSPDTNWSKPWETEYIGEAWDRGDDIPGWPGGTVDFRNLTTSKCLGCAYTAPTDANLFTTQTYYKNLWVTRPTSFQSTHSDDFATKAIPHCRGALNSRPGRHALARASGHNRRGGSTCLPRRGVGGSWHHAQLAAWGRRADN